MKSVRRPRTLDATIADLFGHPRLPEGFRYLPDALSVGEECALAALFDSLPTQPFELQGYQANRRIYTYGHRYVFAGQKPRADAGIPDCLRPLTEIASRIAGVPAELFEQLMVTEYPPGAGIGWHRDRPTFEDIVAISFLAPCALRFRRRQGDQWERQSVLIEPRSAYLLHGRVRNRWQHSIAPMDRLRYSVTLRTFRPGHGATDAKSKDARS